MFTETLIEAVVLRGVIDTCNMERKLSLVLLLFVCEQVNQSRHEHHHNLRHYDKFDKEQAVEEALWSDRQRQTINMVQSHG